MEEVSLSLAEQYDKSAKQYILDVKAGGTDLGNPKHIIEAPNQLWREFDDEIHPKLTAACKLIREWYNDRVPESGGIILCGGFGSGKTHLAKAIHQISGGALAGVVYHNEIEFVKRIQATYSGYGEEHSLLGNIHRAKLLIYDDLGAYQPKRLDWLQGLYLDLFEDFLDRKKAIFITTNLDDNAGQIEDWTGRRVYDRLMGKIGRRELGKKFLIDMFDVPSYR